MIFHCILFRSAPRYRHQGIGLPEDDWLLSRMQLILNAPWYSPSHIQHRCSWYERFLPLGLFSSRGQIQSLQAVIEWANDLIEMTLERHERFRRGESFLCYHEAQQQSPAANEAYIGHRE